MCTSIIHNGNDIIVGFNFDTHNLKHKATLRHNIFFVSVLFNGRWEPIFGVNSDGIFVNEMLNVDNKENNYRKSPSYCRIDLVIWSILTGRFSVEYVLNLLKEGKIVNVPNISLHSHITTKDGNVLTIEPGKGYKYEQPKYSVLTNFSIFERDNSNISPEAGIERYEKAMSMLSQAKDDFSVDDAFAILKETCQQFPCPTVFSMVYSVNNNKVYYTEGQQFCTINEHKFLY